MYEIDALYSPYYKEIDPKKRRELQPEDEFLRELYDDRYSDHERKGRKDVDWWLWRCICLQILYGKGNFLRRFRNREMLTIIRELRMNDETHREYLYHEYRNVCRRYLSTCRSGSYASRFMGFKQANDDEKVIKACEDIWQMSAGVAKKTGFSEEMKLWVEAFRDELFDYDDVCREEYERLNRKE